jgi:plasmid stabilization system protein ParE
MTARCSVEYAESAADDLLQILAWYASQDVPDVGRRLVAAVIERVDQLEMFPDSGRVVPEFGTPWLRELELPPFRIVYRRQTASVIVVRVWRSERLMDPTLGGNAEQALPADAPEVGDRQDPS